MSTKRYKINARKAIENNIGFILLPCKRLTKSPAATSFNPLTANTPFFIEKKNRGKILFLFYIRNKICMEAI